MISIQKISIIIPVYNEQDLIRQFISHLIQINDQNFEIIVVDGDSKKSTINEINQDSVIKISSHKGRATQMNAGEVVATGDILLFLHVDTRLQDNSLAMIRNSVMNNNTVAGSFKLKIKSSNTLLKLIEKMANIRSEFTRVPFGDQAIFINRKFFSSIGKFNNIPILEDVDLMKRIKKRKTNIEIIDSFVSTSPRRWEKYGILNVTLRNLSIQLLYKCGLPFKYLKKIY